MKTNKKSPKKRSRGFRVTRGIHRWLALPLVLFLILFAASGIVLNHRAGFSRINISRKLLPKSFRYDNWNNAAVKGAVTLGDDEVLLYGYVGVWRAHADFTNIRDCNRGLPRGADHRIIETVFKTKQGAVLAGTRYGLYQLGLDLYWHRVPLPSNDKHVVDILEKEESLYILTRSDLITGRLDSNRSLQIVSLQPPPGWDGRISLLRIIWQLHSGELFGIAGRLFVDLLGLGMILLPITGLLMFMFPRLIKRRKRRDGNVARLASTTRWSRRWHRRAGIAMALFLIVCTATGMLLRPPFLLLVFRHSVKPWRGTSLYNASPWHDRLRRLHYDAAYDKFMLSTADGIYFYDGSMDSKPHSARRDPLVSVMGATVQEEIGPGRYLVGSFSGLYLWLPDKDIIMDWISKGPPPGRRPRLPFGEHMVTGYIKDQENNEYFFDYQFGAIPIGHNKPFPPMPPEVKNSPMSLWTLAHETHTGRIYQGFLKQGQLLWIAVSGLLTLIVLISGLLWWWRRIPRIS